MVIGLLLASHVVQIMPQKKGNVMKSRVVDIKIPAESSAWWKPRARHARLRSASWDAKRCSTNTTTTQTRAPRSYSTRRFESDSSSSTTLTYPKHRVDRRDSGGGNPEAQQYLARLRDRR